MRRRAGPDIREIRNFLRALLIFQALNQDCAVAKSIEGFECGTGESILEVSLVIATVMLSISMNVTVVCCVVTERSLSLH